MVQISHPVECSQCGAVNQYEDVTRVDTAGTHTYRRCVICQHEAHMTAMRATHIQIDDVQWRVYDSTLEFENEKF